MNRLAGCRVQLAAALFLLGSSSTPLCAQENGPEPRTLAVTGEGSVQAAPDRARIRVGVVTEARTARAASEENARKMTRVVQAVEKAGIPSEKIQTVQLTIEPVYDYKPDSPPVLRGFSARNVVEAVTPKLSALGEIVDTVIEVGGNTVEGIQFELEDLGAAQTDALERAVADARRKAEGLAKAAGVRLGPVQSIGATYGGPPIPLPMGRMATLEAQAADSQAPVSPGELTVTSMVQVVFLLE